MKLADRILIYTAIVGVIAQAVVFADNSTENYILSVDVIGCESQACEDMLEEIQAADLSSFELK